jgi:hypothetical protein
VSDANKEKSPPESYIADRVADRLILLVLSRPLAVLFSTGSASFLATATTTVGFGATITASHLGLRTLGQMSLIGLTATLLASTIWFPALLRVLEERRRS